MKEIDVEKRSQMFRLFCRGLSSYDLERTYKIPYRTIEKIIKEELATKEKIFGSNVEELRQLMLAKHDEIFRQAMSEGRLDVAVKALAAIGQYQGISEPFKIEAKIEFTDPRLKKAIDAIKNGSGKIRKMVAEPESK